MSSVDCWRGVSGTALPQSTEMLLAKEAKGSSKDRQKTARETGHKLLRHPGKRTSYSSILARLGEGSKIKQLLSIHTKNHLNDKITSNCYSLICYCYSILLFIFFVFFSIRFALGIPSVLDFKFLKCCISSEQNERISAEYSLTIFARRPVCRTLLIDANLLTLTFWRQFAYNLIVENRNDQLIEIKYL